MDGIDRQSLLEAAIRQGEERLRILAAEQADVTAQLAKLRGEHAGMAPAHPAPPEPLSASADGPRTPADKVKLFRAFFRGREDLYPVRFVSKKTGKPGYAPVCSNKFVPGVCELPKVKCGDCTRQAFLPVDDEAVLGHLRGQHVMGVYAVLPDETCWFLAVDFDKSTWREDTRALVERARLHDLPLAIERSRSGQGSHVWFFFSAPVAAVTARKLGCHLITEAMATRHELSMDSYDRLFPSQDTLPRGGFGNLIALPLQHGPRKDGNSIFLDHDLAPIPDDQQWAHLASIQRIDPATVDRIVSAASRAGAIMGVTTGEGSDPYEAAPWSRPPASGVPLVRVDGPLPVAVAAVLAQRLYVEKAGLPSALLNLIKRTAAFQNPEFYKKQSMRLSTALTPRVISCAEDLPQHIALPRGCRSRVEDLLREHGVRLDVDDQRCLGAPLDLRFHGALTALQDQAARALQTHDGGVLVAPPGVGKTVLGTYLVAARGCSTLVLVHRQPLLEQWRAQLALFLGVDPKDVGQIGAGKQASNGRLDVAMIQSLVRRDSVADLVASYGQVIVDECHHLPAVSFERVLSEAKARYVVGLSATPQRRDGHHPITEMQIGPVRFSVDPKVSAARQPFEHRLFVRETSFRLAAPAEAPSIQAIYGAIAADQRRNEAILNDVIGALEAGRSPILLTERRDHLEYFERHLARAARHMVVLQGGMGVKAQRTARQKLAEIPDGEERLLLATGRYIGEGFDDARLDTLFLAMPISWKGTLVQYAGRLHRLHPKKREVQIYDYVDREVPVLLRMFEKRLRGYRSIGYARGEAPLGYAEPLEESVIEYDEGVVRTLDRRPVA
ncbi:MAG: DEAD/DEAH box helicase [Deltaproteobacteria bacterium]|nr:DEAD/DEAH box helicase [Deltaproteobacteria bacterium]